VARFSEHTDTTGNEPLWTAVELIGWDVLLTRVVGVRVVLSGLLVILVE
jgi:hypothetical protein